MWDGMCTHGMICANIEDHAYISVDRPVGRWDRAINALDLPVTVTAHSPKGRTHRIGRYEG